MANREKHIIWSNFLDYERDWQSDLEAEYPNITENERIAMMHRLNAEYLDDARMDLNLLMGSKIIIIADLGLWNGRRMGQKMIGSGLLSDCLYDGDADFLEWYVDELGDLRCTASHHDGCNYYLYRVLKEGLSEARLQRLKCKLYEGTATRRDITEATCRLGDAIADVYGFDIRPTKNPVLGKRMEF